MSFIKFHKDMGPLVCLASVTMNGRIIFNQLSVETYKMSSFSHGILFYDPVEEKIGISLTNNEEEVGAYKFFHTEKSSHINNGRFFDYFDIRPSQKNTYRLHGNEEQGFLVFSLKKIYQPSRKKRKKAS